MSLPSISKSGSITRAILKSYKTVDCSGASLGEIAVPMYSEGGIELLLSIDDEGGNDGGTSTPEGGAVNLPNFKYSAPEFEILSVLDATGVLNEGFRIKKGDSSVKDENLLDKSCQTINEYITKVKKLVYNYIDDTHGPPYVKIIYGSILPEGASSANDSVKSKAFIGRLKEMKVKYILMSKEGHPVRAEMELKFTHVTDPAAAATGQSPDLTHYIDIKHGDSLPNLCKQIYSDPNLFMQIARINNLPSVNAIKPGMRLLFPPLDKASR